MAEKPKFNWKSPLGVAVGLFLFYGALNIFFAIMVPYSLHTMGAGGMGALIVSEIADAKVLGVSLVDLPKINPRLNDFLVTFMDTMCNQMMQFGILQVAIAWFALKARQKWALWALALADLAFLPYLYAIGSVFDKYGVSVGEIWTSFGYFWPMVTVGILLATYLGWKDLEKA